MTYCFRESDSDSAVHAPGNGRPEDKGISRDQTVAGPEIVLRAPPGVRRHPRFGNAGEMDQPTITRNRVSKVQLNIVACWQESADIKEENVQKHLIEHDVKTVIIE
jgi:hypothetical protein